MAEYHAFPFGRVSNSLTLKEQLEEIERVCIVHGIKVLPIGVIHDLMERHRGGGDDNVFTLLKKHGVLPVTKAA